MKRQKDLESKDPSKVVGAIRQAFRETQNGIGKAVGTERKRLIDRNSEETLLLLAEHASGRVEHGRNEWRYIPRWNHFRFAYS